jgi:hypothetical protein
VTVTGWSPTKPMLGEEVEITGTGFSTTASENVVMLDACRGVACATDYPMTVVSATATKIRATLPWDVSGAGYPGAGYFKVAVKGDTALAAGEALFRWPVTARNLENHDYGAGYVRPGDHLEMLVSGLGVPAARPGIHVNGKVADPDSVEFTLNGTPGLEAFASVTFVAPVDDDYPAPGVPTRLDEPTTVNVTIAAANGTVTRSLPALRFPRMTVNGGNNFRKSLTEMANPSTPTHLKKLTVTGHNMVGPISLVFTVPGPETTAGVAATNCGRTLCEQATGPVPPGLNVGTYNVTARFDRFDPPLRRPVGSITIDP